MSLILIRQLCQVNHILTHQQMILLTKHQRKSGNLKRENLQISILQCLQDMGAVWESDQDEESDSFWIGCAGKNRNPANVKRIAITNAIGGYATGIPTFIMITRILVREIWKIALMG